jgi:hypothetical protein
MFVLDLYCVKTTKALDCGRRTRAYNGIPVPKWGVEHRLAALQKTKNPRVESASIAGLFLASLKHHETGASVGGHLAKCEQRFSRDKAVGFLRT